MIQTIILSPSRIGCPSIPGTMKGMMMSIKGVKEVKVHYEERSLDVVFDDAETSESKIIKKIGQEMGLALQSDGKGGVEKENASETCPM